MPSEDVTSTIFGIFALAEEESSWHSSFGAKVRALLWAFCSFTRRDIRDWLPWLDDDNDEALLSCECERFICVREGKGTNDGVSRNEDWDWETLTSSRLEKEESWNTKSSALYASTAVESEVTETSHCEVLDSTDILLNGSHSKSLVLHRLIAALVAVEAVVKPASLVVGDDE
jgi:hypothetical protein